MNKSKGIVFFCLWVCAILVHPVNAQSTLPEKWLGVWKGDLILPGKASQPMSLTINRSTSDSLTWQIAYGPADVRPYKLVASDATGMNWILDEKNGILLPATLSHDTFEYMFQVNNSLLTVRYQLLGSEIRFEVRMFPATPATEQENVAEGVSILKTWKSRVHQLAILKKL